MPHVSFLLAWILLALGVLLLILGWRGRRRGDHQHCRACDFDLTGLPDTTTSCPECGADVGESRGKVRGKHVRSRTMIIVGLTLVLIGGVPPLLGLLHSYRYMPNFALVLMLSDVDARKETATRISDGRLSRSLANYAVNRSLYAQADRTRRWHNSWGAIIEQAAARDMLTPEQLLRYVEEAGAPALWHRSHVQIGRVLPICFAVTGDRLGPQSKLDVTLHGLQFTVDGELIPLTQDQRDNLAGWSCNEKHWNCDSYSMALTSVSKHLGKSLLEVTVKPDYVLTVNTWTSSPMKGTRVVLKTTIQVVEGPITHYVTADASSLEQRAGQVWIWISTNSMTSRPALTFATQDTDLLKSLTLWASVNGKVVRLDQSGWSGTGAGGKQYYETSIDLATLQKAFPGATHVDLLARRNLFFHDLDTTDPGWAGQWLFRQVPLTGKSQRFSLAAGSDRTPTSLVPAVAGNLTPEDAERPPDAAAFGP